MLKYFRVAEICFLIEANGQKAIVQSLLQSAKTAQSQSPQIVSLKNQIQFRYNLFLGDKLLKLTLGEVQRVLKAFSMSAREL